MLSYLKVDGGSIKYALEALYREKYKYICINV